MSRKLKPAEINYDTREKEFLALVDACRHWRQYLHSELPFKLLSDHDSLKCHKTMPNLSGRLARWIEQMSEFNYDIEHIAGVKNVVADALSRRIDMKDEPEQVVAAAQLRRRPAIDDPVAAEVRRIHDRAAAELVLPPAADRPAPNAAGVIKMPSHRCTSNAATGNQCRARTAVGQYCWNHLKKNAGLRVKKSEAPNGGMGLFAARALPKGHRIDYTGDRIATDGMQGGTYFLELSNSTSIDAARTNAGEGRWINDPRGTDKTANCHFNVYTPPGRPRIGCVRTLRPIELGEELLIHYGAAYWRYYDPVKRQLSSRQLRAKKRATGLSRKLGVRDIDDAAVVEDGAVIDAGIVSRKGVVRKRAPHELNGIDLSDGSELALDEAILAAAASDATYSMLSTVPSIDTVVRNGLLWDSTGERLYVSQRSYPSYSYPCSVS